MSNEESELKKDFKKAEETLGNFSKKQFCKLFRHIDINNDDLMMLRKIIRKGVHDTSMQKIISAIMKDFNMVLLKDFYEKGLITNEEDLAMLFNNMKNPLTKEEITSIFKMLTGGRDKGLYGGEKHDKDNTDVKKYEPQVEQIEKKYDPEVEQIELSDGDDESDWTDASDSCSDTSNSDSNSDDSSGSIFETDSDESESDSDESDSNSDHSSGSKSDETDRNERHDSLISPSPRIVEIEDEIDEKQ